VTFTTNGRLPPGSGPVVVCSTNAWFQPEQAVRMKAALAGGGVLCAVRSPYDAALVPNVPALLTYGDVPASLEALAAVLAGKRQAEGRLPVELP
jgi:beta-N-acetylhexosaminidase